MASPPKATNPFYVLLVLVGIVFFVTASAYCVMSVKQLHGTGAADDSQTGTLLLRFLDEHGFQLMMSEIVVLALATVAAIGTDKIHARRTSDETIDGGRPSHDQSAESNE